MPLVILRVDYPRVVPTATMLKIRDLVHQAVADVLDVGFGEVEIWVKKPGLHDVNSPPIAILILTGTGKNKCRVAKKQQIARTLDRKLTYSGLLKSEWLDPSKSYVWVLIGESAFVQIGFPEQM